MKLLHEAALGGAGVSVVLGLLAKGYFGTGFFAVQLTVTLCAICLAPLLQRANSAVPKTVRYLFFAGMLPFAVPVFYALIINLFTGHRVPGATAFDAIWRVWAIVGLWIGFAKVNETYIRPAIRESGILNFSVGSGVMSSVARMAEGKRNKALEAIKQRLVPVIQRRKKAEKLIVEKKKELESARAQAEKSERLLEKKQKKLGEADPEEMEELEEERDALLEMMKNAKKYLETLESQIENAGAEIKECNEVSQKMQKEWTEARHIENHVGFYR